MKKIIKGVISLLIVFLVIGCIGNSNSNSPNSEKIPNLNENNIINSITKEVKINEDEFSDGIVQQDIEIAVKSQDGKERLKTIIPTGTEFKDKNGRKIETPPIVAIGEKEGKAKSVKEGRSITENIIKSELKITDEDGNKLIPSEPITVTIKAPAGSKPGDEVRVDIPDGTEKARGEQKLTVFIVDSNGNITIVILPTVFKKYDVVVIIIEKKIEAILTGGTGGS